jgi:Cytochrome c biogenesis factor
MASGGEVTYCLCIECCRLYRLATFVVANAAFVSSVVSFFNSESFLSFLRAILCFMSEGSLKLFRRRGSYEE